MECSQCSSVAMKFPLEEKMSGFSCLCAGLAAAELGWRPLHAWHSRSPTVSSFGDPCNYTGAKMSDSPPEKGLT